MRDYAEQVKRLRNQAKLERYYHGSGRICDEAADAIEELVAMACPHYHRNVHDRGDDSYCDVLNTEPPKEKA